MAFGNGWASADDLVGHEFTHGVLDHEARLFYAYQSGALNEGFADIFGEFIDQTYPGGRDTTATRWLIGEDLPGGAVRDMQTPGRFGYPDRIRQPALLRGDDRPGWRPYQQRRGEQGRRAHDRWRLVQRPPRPGAGTDQGRGHRVRGDDHLLTSAADYNDLYDALQQACVDLVGVDGIDLADCRAVHEAVAATEMDRQPRVGWTSTCASTCPTGRYAQTTFLDDFEDVAKSQATWALVRAPWQSRHLVLPAEPQQRPELGWHVGVLGRRSISSVTTRRW